MCWYLCLSTTLPPMKRRVSRRRRWGSSSPSASSCGPSSCCWLCSLDLRHLQHTCSHSPDACVHCSHHHHISHSHSLFLGTKLIRAPPISHAQTLTGAARPVVTYTHTPARCVRSPSLTLSSTAWRDRLGTTDDGDLLCSSFIWCVKERERERGQKVAQYSSGTRAYIFPLYTIHSLTLTRARTSHAASCSLAAARTACYRTVRTCLCMYICIYIYIYIYIRLTVCVGRRFPPRADD